MTPVVVWVLCSPLPIPRMLKSVPRPKLLIVVEGATNCSWSTTSTPNLDRSSPDRTVAETAAVCNGTSRYSAVTVTVGNAVTFLSLVGDCASSGGCAAGLSSAVPRGVASACPASALEAEVWACAGAQHSMAPFRWSAWQCRMWGVQEPVSALEVRNESVFSIRGNRAYRVLNDRSGPGGTSSNREALCHEQSWR